MTDLCASEAVKASEPAPPPPIESDADDDLTVAYCVTIEQAKVELQDVLADAAGRPLGLDTETTALPAEAERLQALELRQAEIKGELKAAKRAKASQSEIAVIEADQKLIKARIKYAHTAALDPHRARIRAVQLYGGGRRVMVIDLFRAGPGALHLLNGLDVVAHNAAFELAHLEAAGVELGAVHCSMQMARCTLGERSMSLADAARAHLGVELDKAEQLGNWAAPQLTDQQIEYAALDAVMTFRLAERIVPVLGPQTSAYEIQVGCTPAVARMRSRGVLLDLAAHTALMRWTGLKRTRLCSAYKAACIAMGLPGLAAKVPTTPALKRAALEAILSSDELKAWQRTKKTGVLSSARSDLRRAAHYPPIRILARLAKTDKLLSAFGPTLVALVSPVTGRIHANYRVAADTTGRAACSYPNIPSCAEEQAVSRAVSGGRRL